MQAGSISSGLLQMQTAWNATATAQELPQALHENSTAQVVATHPPTFHFAANSSWPAVVDFGFREEVTVGACPTMRLPVAPVSFATAR